MFLLYSLSLGAPFGPLGLGAPGFGRSEPIVVTPLIALILEILRNDLYTCTYKYSYMANLNFVPESRTSKHKLHYMF
jgi:hypothetical protein